ncbi:YihY/virulence factor BrkB family protein [Pigmentiphaga sp.]|jgi:Predicted membrane protein|uniref:YihY/virulence factor BrkB family protein n=1 Tax=Pigmentiphaga sp. TaxID=1977564 RepID=UPI0025DD81B2|nr:YihY/virulence factor BrkB family protein [Pigmentiphaga sp.]MBX6317490.1 YihY/virulence factor BrkB family protein [Pigmentiphaga sp.]
MDLRSRLERFRRTLVVSLAWDTVRRWSAHRASSKGAALALYMVFSLAPILLLVIAIAGAFFGEEAVRNQLVGQMRSLTGQQGAEAIQTVLASAQQSDKGWAAALISTVLLMFSATTAFAELKDSLDELWDVPASKTSGVWAQIRSRLLSFGLVLVLALFLLISLTVNAALTALQDYWHAFWVESAFATTAMLASSLFSFAVVTALFAVVFKLLPSTSIPWRDVLPGALVTAVLFSVGKSVIGLYLGHGNVASSYGVAGSVIALILWIYYSAQIFFFGAAFTRQYADTFGQGRRRRPGPVQAPSRKAGRTDAALKAPGADRSK